MIEMVRRSRQPLHTPELGIETRNGTGNWGHYNKRVLKEQALSMYAKNDEVLFSSYQLR